MSSTRSSRRIRPLVWHSLTLPFPDRVRLLRRCVDEDGGLDRTEELAVVQVMCTVAERIKTVRCRAFAAQQAVC